MLKQEFKHLTRKYLGTASLYSLAAHTAATSPTWLGIAFGAVAAGIAVQTLVLGPHGFYGHWARERGGNLRKAPEEIQEATNRLTQRAGVPATTTLLDDQLNCSAAVDQAHFVHVNREFFDKAGNIAEQDGMIAHEVAHIKNGDLGQSTFNTYLCHMIAVTAVAWPLWPFFEWSQIGMHLLGIPLAYGLSKFNEHEHEYLADIGSAKLMGSAAPMKDMCERVKERVENDPDKNPRIFNQLAEQVTGRPVHSRALDAMDEFIRSHPTPAKRIENLERTQRELDAAGVRLRPVRRQISLV